MKGDSSMSHAIFKGVALAIVAAPLLVACGGGKADDPGPVNPSQCSGSSCGVQGPPTQGAGAAALCPADADIVKSIFLGGAGSGEVVSMNIDATAMTYTLKWLESPIPLRTGGDPGVTRAGVTITGRVIHPPTGTLPTPEQTRCAFVLGAGTGTGASDGQPYTTPDFVNNPNPPMVFVGLGVAGGGIPGADVEYAGVGSIGAVPQRHFDFYPFLGFASTTTDISKLPGTYNTLLYHIVPSGNYTPSATNAVESFDANGACTSPSGSCLSTGDPLTVNSNGYFDSTHAPQIGTQTQVALGITTGKSGKAHMILGQLNGATVPLVIRTGNVNTNILTLAIDDESGIALLAKSGTLVSGGFDGGYVGADSNFRYTATLIQGGVGTFINPTTAAAESGFGLSYTMPSPGLIGVQDKNGKQGLAIASGGLYAIFVNGAENGGVAPTSANTHSTTGTDNSSVPYFGVGAQISK
jgi:hypothetical protein